MCQNRPVTKCVLHTDKMIVAGGDPDPAGLPDAVTWAPVMQKFTFEGQPVVAPVVLPVCYDCRSAQVASVSRSGLSVISGNALGNGQGQ